MRSAACCLFLLGTALAGEPEPPKVSKQFGTERLDFTVAGQRAFLLRPTKPAPDGSKPWLWYAPTFIGMHPDPSHAWMFERLLGAGFTVCGIEVGESFGSPKGRAIYTELHQHVTKAYGLSEKACLLPQSRGGLMLYNWAAEHPDWVQCIGGIYTVCDLTSYPGPARACGAYGLKEAEFRERLKEHNPIERLAPLAKAKVPILHLHGDSDSVVPLERNSGELARRYRALGGPVELVVVKGKGHQVCDEFFKSQRLVDFFLSLGKAAAAGADSARPFEGLRALVIEPENSWGWDAAIYGALHERGFQVAYESATAVEDAAALSQYDLVASNIRRSFTPAQVAKFKEFVAAGGALYGSWGGPMGNADLLRDVCRVASTRSVRIAGMSLLPDTPLSKSISDLDVPFPTQIGHAASKAWEIVAVTPLPGGIAVAKDAAGNVLGVLAQHAKGRTAILGFGPEKEKQFVRRELGPAMMDNLLACLLEDRLKRKPQAWPGSLYVSIPARAEFQALTLGAVTLRQTGISEFGSIKGVGVDVSRIPEGEEATIKVAYRPLAPARNVETIIHLPWASLPRGGPPAKLAEWLKSVNATTVQPLLREPNGHAYYRGMPEDTPDPISVTAYPGNYLADFIEECHKRGIKVIGGVYFESRTTLKHHPEAALVEKGGAKSTKQACFNNPDGQEYNLATIRHLLDNYRLDGVILDDNYELQNYACFCPFCDKGLKEYCAHKGVAWEEATRPSWGPARAWLDYRREATRGLALKVAGLAHERKLPAGGWTSAGMGSLHLGTVFDFLGGMVYTEPPRAARLMLASLGKCRFITLLWAPGERPERIEQEFREAVHAGSAIAGFWVYPPGHEGTGGMKMLPGSHEAIGRAFAGAEEEWLRFYRNSLLTGDPRFVLLEGKVGQEEAILRIRNTGKRASSRIQGVVDIAALVGPGGTR